MIFLAILIVFLALVFDFSNGFHDSSNIVATMISTRALSPVRAFVLAAVFEFLGAYFLGTRVAEMIGRGIVDPIIIQNMEKGILVVFAVLIGAISWNFFTWYFGIPSSSSHALIGGILGSILIACGPGVIRWKNVLSIFAVLVTSPILGLAAGFIFTRMVLFMAQWSSPSINNFFKKIQIFSSIGLALSHGTNDAQKTMGLLTFSLIVLGVYEPPEGTLAVPKWIIIACAAAIALGIAFGGRRIIKTLGMKIYKIRPVHGFCAQATSASIIYGAALIGFPVSTTQIVSSSIVGTGSAERPKAVRWEIIGNIVLVWFITIPCTAFVSSMSYLVLRLLTG